jgi:beta-fructofuranosidase
VRTDPHRPALHVTPTTGWLNDPNGLMHWRGQHHLFYQHNPDAARWGNIHWAHTTSSDLIHWQPQPQALTPNSSFDTAGCWSGSALEVNSELHLFYTATSRYDPVDDSGAPTIALASSRDGMHFRKRGVVLESPHPLTFLGARPGEWMGWRDPVVWQDENRYLMTVGAGIRGRGGVVMLYESTSLETWTEVGELLAGDAPELEGLELGEVWECPQLLRMNGGDVLLLCPWTNRRGSPPVALVGRFDGSRFHASSHGVLDAGDLYAPQAWQDETGRWLLIGWLPEKRSVEAQLEAGYAGCMSFVRQLSLENGVLQQRPVTELEGLREKRLEEMYSGSALEIRVSSQENDAVQRHGVKICASPDDAEFTLVYLEGDELVLDRRQSSLNDTVTRDERRTRVKTQSRDLQVFVDGSVIEAFCAGVALSARVYPTRSDALEVHAIGAVSLEVWSLTL